MYLDEWFACASVQSRRRNRYVCHNYGNNFMCHLYSDFTTVFNWHTLKSIQLYSVVSCSLELYISVRFFLN